MALTLAGTPAINGLALPSDTFVSGMVLLNPTTTTFTTATSVVFNNVFTSTYENYKIVITSPWATSATIGLRLRASGTDNTTANSYKIAGVYTNMSSVAVWNQDTNIWSWGSNGSSPADVSAVIDLFGPATTNRTGMQAVVSSGGNQAIWGPGFHTATSAFDGMDLIAGSAVSGTIRIYGLRNA